MSQWQHTSYSLFWTYNGTYVPCSPYTHPEYCDTAQYTHITQMCDKLTDSDNCLAFLSVHHWCGARVCGPKYYAVNLILRLFFYHFLHTMSSWRHESIHNNTNNQQTPPPWWWSRSPLQRRGFNKSTPSERRAVLLIFVLRPLLKGLDRLIKYKFLLINFYQPLHVL